MKISNNVLSIATWLKDYKKEYLRGDIYAGITVGIMLIPQGMAYALIVGVPPVYGLYAAIIPQIVYALMGTSRKLSIAPVATDSLIVASGLSTIAITGTENFLVLTIILALVVGVIQLILGLMRMGFITNLLSRPVITGFTAAAAVIIGTSQLKHLFGISSQNKFNIINAFTEIFSKHDSIQWLAFFIGLMGIAIIVVSKRTSKVIPGSLIAVSISIALVYFLGWNHNQIEILKEIPQGFPSFKAPSISIADIQALLPLALTLALISFMESYSIAKAIESPQKDHKINPNQELIALGSANIIGSLFQSFPTAGGFSRSAVNSASGANTPLASIISAILVALTLIFLTPVFYYLPKAVLASIILVSIVNLIDGSYIRKLYFDNKFEFLIMVVTFLTTVIFSIVTGILTGVFLSILYLLYKSAYPHIAQLGRVKDHHEFRNIKRFDELEIWKNVIILRVDASLSFINIQFFKDYIDLALNNSNDSIKTIILDAGPISFMDATAVNGIKEIVLTLKEKNINFLICDMIGPVRDTLHKSGLLSIISEENVFFNLTEAVRYATTKNQGRYKEYALQSNIKTH